MLLYYFRDQLTVIGFVVEFFVVESIVCQNSETFPTEFTGDVLKLLVVSKHVQRYIGKLSPAGTRKC